MQTHELRCCAPAAELNSAFTQVCHCLAGKAAREVQDDDGMSSEHYGDRRGATAWTRAAFAAVVLLLSLAGSAAAGPLEDAAAASDRGDHATARRLLRPLADQGDARAQYILGVIYANGKNYGEALKWHRLAAAQGHPGAQFNLGLMYFEGQGVPKNYAEAVKWYRLAADQGDAAAQNNLGVAHHNGKGVPQDDAEAVV